MSDLKFIGANRVTIETDEAGPFFRLEAEGAHKPMDVRVQFDRRGQIGLRTDLLARAIGFKKNQPLKIFDGTAGLCRDSFHFFCLGCEVVAIESQPLIFDVVSAQLTRQVHSEKFRLIRGDAVEYLLANKNREGFNVIYLDPIFAQEKRKSARSGKESELLRALAPEPDESADSRLLAAALQLSGVRVVVKRALRAKEISLEAGAAKFVLSKHSVKGSAVRYDVYVT